MQDRRSPQAQQLGVGAETEGLRLPGQKAVSQALGGPRSRVSGQLGWGSLRCGEEPPLGMTVLLPPRCGNRALHPCLLPHVSTRGLLLSGVQFPIPLPPLGEGHSWQVPHSPTAQMGA